MNGIHSTGSRAGTLLNNNCIIGAHIGTLSAFDAFVLINDRFSAGLFQRNGSLRTYFHTGMSHTSLASVCDNNLLFRAGIAGKFNDVD